MTLTAGFVRSQPLGTLGALIVGTIVIAAIAAPIVSPYDPVEPHYADRLAAPGARFLLGTNQFGHDVLSRIIWGARVSVLVGFLSAAIGVTAGAVWGLASGYLGGTFDVVSQRAVDALLSFPVLILTLTVVAMFGASTGSVVAAIALAVVPQGARPVRSVALSLRASQFVEAARAVGAENGRIMLRHIVPNCVTPYIVVLSAHFGWAIVVEASLSFLGFGPPPPTPSWGRMLSEEGRRYLLQAPWLSIFPGLAISLAVLGFSLFGDAVLDTLDPRLRAISKP
jgi:peptide/nickel transport system permease protein